MPFSKQGRNRFWSGNQEFDFGCVKFKMPTGQPSGNVEQANEYRYIVQRRGSGWKYTFENHQHRDGI